MCHSSALNRVAESNSCRLCPAASHGDVDICHGAVWELALSTGDIQLRRKPSEHIEPGIAPSKAVALPLPIHESARGRFQVKGQGQGSMAYDGPCRWSSGGISKKGGHPKG
jgi:hypothetical protein